MNLWITARALGFSALLLLTASVCVGASVSGGHRGDGRRLVGQYVHRWLAAMGLFALAIHVGTILADSFAHVGVLGALVPLQSRYRPVAVALGTAAVYCILLVGVTGWGRGRLARSASAVRAWRAVHTLAYLGWAAAMVHGFTAGSDGGTAWARAIYLACLAAVGGCFAVRLAALIRPAQPRRTSAVLQSDAAR